MQFPLKRWPKLIWALIHTRNPMAHRLVAMLPHKRLDRPIFIVGLPRSGTSIYVRLFGANRQVAEWSEAPVVWDPDWRNRENEHRWTSAQATAKAIRRIDNNFAYYTKWKGCSRFVNKHPRNSLRVPFLVAGWPDAYLVNIVRDPRAVAYSLVTRTRAETWRHSYPLGQFARPSDWRELDRIPNDVEKFSRAVVSMHRTLTDDLRAIPDPDRLLEVRYETFAEDVRGMLRQSWDFCGIPKDEAAANAAPQRLENRNYKWAKQLTAEELQIMYDVLTPIVIETGYEPDEHWLDRAKAARDAPGSGGGGNGASGERPRASALAAGG